MCKKSQQEERVSDLKDTVYRLKEENAKLNTDVLISAEVIGTITHSVNTMIDTIEKLEKDNASLKKIIKENDLTKFMLTEEAKYVREENVGAMNMKLMGRLYVELSKEDELR